jgi:acetyltransferase
MTTRNFDALFTPKAIALVGASNRPGSVGAVLARNLLEGGFSGAIMPVNPHERAIRSTLAYPSIEQLPFTPDLAVVATPAPTVPAILADLGAKGCRAAVVITAGFGPLDSPLRQAMLDAAKPHLMRVVGPNCLGFMSPGAGINASFAHLTPTAGDVAFVSQSGAIATTMLDWAVGRGIGFSHLVSVGDMGDVDFGDLLDHLALDPATRSILLYVETVTSPRKFMSAARIASRAKPVIVVKGGRSQSGAKAAQSHTGALAGSDAVYDAAFRRAGMLRVFELRELFEAAATLASGVRVGGDRLTILTNGGGLGVLAADALEQRGGRLSTLSEGAVAALDRVLPAGWSGGNPIDILGDAKGDRYQAALEILAGETGQDAILVMNCPTGVAEPGEGVDAVLAAKAAARAPVLSAWVGEATAAASRTRLSRAQVPAYETPDEAVAAFMQLVEHRRGQAALLETPPAGVLIPPEARDRARAVVEAALAEGRDLLTEPEAKAVLEAFQIPVVKTLTAVDAEAAARHAETLGGPVVLKILSREITHKSDVGGVRLDLHSPAAVAEAAREMLAAVAKAAPGARVDGFTVQSMIRRPGARELIAGIADDATFGPVLLFGQGGVAVEVLADRAVGLAPLNALLARDMIARTRVSRLLEAYRDRPRADIEAVVSTLVKLSELTALLPEVVELDINPLLADEQGVLALDARIVVRKPDADPFHRFAIRAYPVELEKAIVLADGASLTLRPIRPEDESALTAMIAASSESDRRLRFFGALGRPPQALAARLSQIDYDREMAFVAQEDDGALAGVGRMVSDPNFETAEFALMVRTDMQGRGIGYRLMTELNHYARSRGHQVLYGDVTADNAAMLAMAGELGAGVTPVGEARRVVFDLLRPENRQAP